VAALLSFRHLSLLVTSFAMLVPSLRAQETVTPAEVAPQTIKPAEIAPQADVYLLRGGLGVFSLGLDALAEKMNAENYTTHVCLHLYWRGVANSIRNRCQQTPIVLIGHSYGADDVIKIASQLEMWGISVDLLVTLDPVLPAPIPKNVRHTVNLFCAKHHYLNFVPIWRGVPVYGENGNLVGNVENIDVRCRPDIAEPGVSHGSIDDSPLIHQHILMHSRNLGGAGVLLHTTNRVTPTSAQPAPSNGRYLSNLSIR
jgi:hypothetical protein